MCGEVEREEILNTPASLSIHVVYLCVCVWRDREFLNTPASLSDTLGVFVWRGGERRDSQYPYKFEYTCGVFVCVCVWRDGEFLNTPASLSDTLGVFVWRGGERRDSQYPCKFE